jgi:hypothetical protein
MQQQSTIIDSMTDSIIIALDAKGPINTALEVIRVATKTASKMSNNVEDNTKAVKGALITILSGPDGELYTKDDLLPESVMRDIIDIMNTGLVDQLVEFFTTSRSFIKKIVCCAS